MPVDSIKGSQFNVANIQIVDTINRSLNSLMLISSAWFSWEPRVRTVAEVGRYLENHSLGMQMHSYKNRVHKKIFPKQTT